MFDQNLGPRLARVLDAWDPENKVSHITELDGLGLSEKSTDIEWMSALSSHEDEWAVFTADRTLLRDPAELQVFKDSGVSLFIAARNWKGVTPHDQCWKLLKLWPQVVEFAKRSRKAIYKIRTPIQKVEVEKYVDALR